MSLNMMGPFKKRETSGMPISINPVLFAEQEKVTKLSTMYNSILKQKYNVQIKCLSNKPFSQSCTTSFVSWSVLRFLLAKKNVCVIHKL